MRRILGAIAGLLLLATSAPAQVTPGVPLATNSVFGKMHGDGTTITCVAGVCATVASGGIVIASTTITGGNDNGVLFQAAGTVSETTAAASCVIATNSSNVPACRAFLPNINIGVPTAGVATNLTGTASGLTAGNVTTNANLTGPVTSTGNATAIATGAITQTMVAASTLATGTSVSLTAPRQYYVCTGTCTVTPPVPAAGSEFCVRNDNNVATVITFAALGSSAMYEKTAYTSYGTAGTGTAVSGGAAGDKLCILGRDATHYLVMSFNGTWTMN